MTLSRPESAVSRRRAPLAASESGSEVRPPGPPCIRVAGNPPPPSPAPGFPSRRRPARIESRRGTVGAMDFGSRCWASIFTASGGLGGTPVTARAGGSAMREARLTPSHPQESLGVTRRSLLRSEGLGLAHGLERTQSCGRPGPPGKGGAALRARAAAGPVPDPAVPRRHGQSESAGSCTTQPTALASSLEDSRRHSLSPSLSPSHTHPPHSRLHSRCILF